MLHHKIEEPFKYTSTKTYIVDFPKPITLSDLIDVIAEKHPDEFGHIYVDDKPQVTNQVTPITYKFGHMDSDPVIPWTRKIDSWMHRLFIANVISVIAKSGYGLTDYYIQTENKRK